MGDLIQARELGSVLSVEILLVMTSVTKQDCQLLARSLAEISSHELYCHGHKLFVNDFSGLMLAISLRSCEIMLVKSYIL